jgi:Short C-terminal domain
VRRVRINRNRQTDLLARPPCGARVLGRGWSTLIVDPVEQLAELADLRRRGLLSGEEYERQKAKILEPYG